MTFFYRPIPRLPTNLDNEQLTDNKGIGQPIGFTEYSSHNQLIPTDSGSFSKKNTFYVGSYKVFTF